MRIARCSILIRLPWPIASVLPLYSESVSVRIHFRKPFPENILRNKILQKPDQLNISSSIHGARDNMAYLLLPVPHTSRPRPSGTGSAAREIQFRKTGTFKVWMLRNGFLFPAHSCRQGKPDTSRRLRNDLRHTLQCAATAGQHPEFFCS